MLWLSLIRDTEKSDFLMKHEACFLNISLSADLRGIGNNIGIIHLVRGQNFEFTFVYQGVRNVSFPENLTYVLIG